MLEQIKVLNGILALDEFTVASLAEFSGVKLPTVHTVLYRRKEFFAPIGINPTGRPGGQTIRYRLKPSAIAELRAEINHAAAAVALHRRQAPFEEAAPESLNLESAEEFLERRVSQAQSTAEKRLILDTADVYLKAARQEFQVQFGDSASALSRERAGRLTALVTLRDNIAAALPPINEEISPPAAEIQEDAAELVSRMVLVDVVMALVSRAEKASEPVEREVCLTEARRTIDSCRSILVRRKALAPEGPVASLEVDFQAAEDRISRLETAENPASQPDKATILKFLIEERAAELMRRAEMVDQARPGSDRWLSALAELETTPSGRDAEVGFFGGYLVARGKMGRTQNTFMDNWLRSIASRRARQEAELAGPSWPALQEKFALSLGRMIECGAGRKGWEPILENCLDGLTNTAPLAVVPSIHEHVGHLVIETTWGRLRRSCQEFLQQYSQSARMVRHIAAVNAAVAGHTIDPYFASGPRRFDASVDVVDTAGKRRRARRTASNDDPVSVDLVAAFRMKFGNETDTAHLG